MRRIVLWDEVKSGRCLPNGVEQLQCLGGSLRRDITATALTVECGKSSAGLRPAHKEATVSVGQSMEG